MPSAGLPVPLGSSFPAAVAFTVIYSLLSTVSYGFFGVWKYVPYLDAALGAGGKFLGFLLRSLFLKSSDLSVFGASQFFITAGMSACTCAQTATLGDWFKHSGAARRLGFHARHPRVLPALCKLLAIPVLIFGPGLGIPATILAYGVMTRSSVLDAMTLRKWSAWGTLACLALLTLLALLALVLAALRSKEDRAARRGEVGLVAATLASILLLEISGAARVRNVYDSSVSLDDDKYYTLIVLPELLQQLITSIPTLLHRTGLADSYVSWRTGTWAWVGRAFPVVAPAPEADEAPLPKSAAASAKDGSCGTAEA